MQLLPTPGLQQSAPCLSSDFRERCSSALAERILRRDSFALMEEVGAFARKKCPCCNNPWNLAEESGSTTHIYACSPCLQDNKGFKGLDPNNIDFSVSPSENFYLWSNGNWKKQNEIPPEYASWNTFIQLRDMNLERIKSILSGFESNKDLSGSDLKLANFYRSAMDEDTIESLGVSVLDGMLKLCTEVKKNPGHRIGELHGKYGVRVLFSLYSSPDKKNSEHSIATVSQSGLGLPDRDYYFDEDKADKREKYIGYISKLFALLYKGNPSYECYSTPAKCLLAAREVMLMETAFASAFLTRTACRDPELTYNKMSIVDLKALTRSEPSWRSYLARGAPNDLQWDEYFETIGKPSQEMGEVNVGMVDAIKRMNVVVNHPSLEHYLVFHCLNSYAPHLTREFVETHFNFHEKELKGTAEQRPRWKRALEALEDAMGFALGVSYVNQYFAGDAKIRALRVVESVKHALRQRLSEVDWMGESTKKEAFLKMEKFRVKIGFPDKWVDYSALDIIQGKHLENVARGREFNFNLDLSRMNAPTDRDRWFMTPQTVNAYYHPSLNEIVFPAAILQPPFFDPDADEAVNFGSMGAVVGHEMTHGFDDQGRKFDHVLFVVR